MNRKKVVGSLGAILVGFSMMGSSCDDQNIVDGKAIVEVPATDDRPASVCYLLEIERQDVGGAEVGEGYECVIKAEFDKNNVGEVWVDVDGRAK